jgi:cytochrome c oxidase cbb3-type subunit 3/ubiquinol-cytochrome c reductase cytochrome c subunit
MKSARPIALIGLCCAFWWATGCRAPGKPGPEPEVVRPEQVLEFATLYKQNCAACHGENGRRGLDVSLANPVYLALAGKDALVNATAKGVPGELMPAFAKSHGGTLTDQQIEILAEGMQTRWGHPQLLAGLNPPPYAATGPGDAATGEAAFASYCARCHGGNANQSGQATVAGPVTDPSFLALISDQGLRTAILSGRPEDGMPDWRGFGQRPLSDREVTDLVAWLAAQRKAAPGQPYPEHP